MGRSRSRTRSTSRRRSRSPPSVKREGGPNREGRRSNPPESKIIGIFGMSDRTDERTLRDECEKFGRLEKCCVVYDRDRRSRGFAFVTFEELDDARDARDALNGKDIDGREVRVDFSITRRAHSPTPGQYKGRDRRRSRSRSRDRRRSRSRSRDRYRRRSRSRSRDRYRRRSRSRSRDRGRSRRSRSRSYDRRRR